MRNDTISISIAICELDADNASCRTLKTDLKKILVDDISGLENVVEYDDIVPLDAVHELYENWEAFVKRNRISDDADTIYLDKIRDFEDLQLLRPISERVSTGWVSTSDLSDELLRKAIANSKEENRLTGWDMLTFDEMNEMCASCSLSWDKGRGCIGSFGPDNSVLPEIAGRRGCNIVAAIPEEATVRRIFTPDEAAKLLEEVKVLTNALPEEGKVYVRRYTGVLERLKAVAEISMREGCGFYFF